MFVFFSLLSSSCLGGLQPPSPTGGSLPHPLRKGIYPLRTLLGFCFRHPYHLLNTPGVSTRFPFDTISRPSVLDLAFVNTALSPLVSLWDTPLPSTGSDYVPCVITLKPPAILLPPPTPHWGLRDLHGVREALDAFVRREPISKSYEISQDDNL